MGHLETVQAIYDAFGQGDVPAIIDVMAEDVEWEHWNDNHAQNAGVPSLQARNGKTGVGEFFAVAATMRITDFQVLNMMEGGDQVAVTVVIETDVPGGGLPQRGDPPLVVRRQRQGEEPAPLHRHGEAHRGLGHVTPRWRADNAFGADCRRFRTTEPDVAGGLFGCATKSPRERPAE